MLAPIKQNGTCSVASQRHCAAGLAKVDGHSNGTDRGDNCANAPVAPFSVMLSAPFAAATLLSCEPII